MKLVKPDARPGKISDLPASAADIFERTAALHPDRIALICRLGNAEWLRR
jgi:hypothetical protein